MPTPAAEQLKAQGNELFKAKKYHDAIKKYQQALKHSPDYVDALSNIGVCYYLLKNYDAALESFYKVLEHDKTHSKAINKIAEILQIPPLTDTQHLALQKHLQRYKAKVYVLSADLKLTKDNEIKLLEITRAYQSGFRGSYFRGVNLSQRLEAVFQHYQLPLFQIKQLGDHMQPIPTQLEEKRQATDANIAAIRHESQVKDFTQLKSYKACYSTFKFPKTNPIDPILTIDDIPIALCCENKFFMHEAAKKQGLENYRPKTYYLSRTSAYDPAIPARILSECPSTRYFVVKAPSLEESKGVLIISRDELAHKIKLMQQFLSNNKGVEQLIEAGMIDPQDVLLGRPTPVVNMSQEQTECFLIEEYIANKPVFQSGKIYDPTIRIFFVLTFDQHRWQYHYLDAYYRLPDHNIADRTAGHRDRAIPSYSDNRKTVMSVPEGDLSVINAQMQALMPQLASSIIQQDYFMIFEQTTDPAVKTYYYLLLSNEAVFFGNYRLAEIALHKAEAIGCAPKKFNVHHQRGILYTEMKRYADAIKEFNIAESLNPSFVHSKCRRALVYYLMGQTGKYFETINAAMMNSSEHRKIKIFCLQYNLPLPEADNTPAEECVIS